VFQPSQPPLPLWLCNLLQTVQSLPLLVLRCCKLPLLPALLRLLQL
jgi:hypothetical protein